MEKDLVAEAMKKVSVETKNQKTEVPNQKPTVTNVVNKQIRPTVTVKYRGIETVVERKMFINVQESPDGLIFNFANGMHLVYTNQHMPPSAKVRVTAAANALLGGSKTTSLIIDLNNPTKPVKAIL